MIRSKWQSWLNLIETLALLLAWLFYISFRNFYFLSGMTDKSFLYNQSEIPQLESLKTILQISKSTLKQCHELSAVLTRCPSIRRKCMAYNHNCEADWLTSPEKSDNLDIGDGLLTTYLCPYLKFAIKSFNFTNVKYFRWKQWRISLERTSGRILSSKSCIKSGTNPPTTWKYANSFRIESLTIPYNLWECSLNSCASKLEQWWLCWSIVRAMKSESKNFV
jgi:hypothetical protein